MCAKGFSYVLKKAKGFSSLLKKAERDGRITGCPFSKKE
jgi:hypothetical protein